MSTSPNKASILIVDDQPENLLLLTSILKGSGHDVRQVKSGERALKMAAAAPPDLVLLDVMMPGIDGYEVCRRLKGRVDLKNIPVIFLSALNDSTDKVRAFAVGGIDYVAKPLNPDEVLARVEAHLAIRRQHNNLEQEVQELREDGLAASSKEVGQQATGINLTDREKECLMWLARGLRNDRIAEKLGIKPVTVELHIANARKKLDAETREQALALAVQIGAITP